MLYGGFWILSEIFVGEFDDIECEISVYIIIN